MIDDPDADSAAAPWRIDQADCLDFLESLTPASVDCITTDPAYSGMNQHLRLGHGRIVGHYQSADNQRWFTEFPDDEQRMRALLAACHRSLCDGGHLYIMFDSFSLLSLGALVRECFEVKGIVVWDKMHLGMGHYFRRRHELIVFATKGKRKLLRRDLPDVWPVPRLHRAPYPTQKPVALFSRMLQASCQPGMTVCDPFMGSGSAAIAALQAGCQVVGADIAASAVTMANERCRVFSETGIDPLEKPAMAPVPR